jgi:beta-barrel assembly-enhancing protease
MKTGLKRLAAYLFAGNLATLRSLLVPMLTLILVCSCAVNPVTGKNELSLVSEQSEIRIGSKQYLPTQQSQGGLYTVDKDLSLYVDDVGQRLARVSDRQLPYEFVVLNDGVPNAWALPGGKIAVNRGLLLRLSSEAELAAVLAHEIIHAAARHGAKTIERGTILQGALTAASISLEKNQTRNGNMIMGTANLGAQLINQGYSRSAELEADYFGILYMARAGFDPNAAVSLQETFVLLSESRKQNWLSGLFASHPPSQERVDRNRQTVLELEKTVRGDFETGADRYQKKLTYLASKSEAYQAFDKAQQAADAGNYTEADRQIRAAIKGEPKEPRFRGLQGDIAYQQNQYDAAIIHYNTALKTDPNYYGYYLGKGLVLMKIGKIQAARSDLKKSNQLLPNATATHALGEISLQKGDKETAKEYFRAVMNGSGSLADTAKQHFIILDIEQNPKSYIDVQTSIRDQEIILKVTNSTPLEVSKLAIAISIESQGRSTEKTLLLNDLQGYESQFLQTGIRPKASIPIAIATRLKARL